MLGSILLLGCALVHILAIAASIPMAQRMAGLLQPRPAHIRISALLSFGVLALVFAHTIQVWAWAIAFYELVPFETFPASFYFAMVTYTTLGYGDIVLSEGQRIFATFAAVTGLLTFGISTAVLIGYVVRLLPDAFEDRN